nr:light-harvesting chlorophyll a/b-binding protein [Hevea brasiliensis]
MAALSPPSPQVSTTPFLSPRLSFQPKTKPHLCFIPRATTDDDTQPESSPQPQPESEDDPFESRLSKIRLRYRSGTGKKAEVRKAKKGVSKPVSGSGMYLPPVPLKEATSDGLKVEFGFSQYSERVNGRIAILGLTALILVELATGKGVINYHTPAIVLIQVYFVAAVGALYIKYEKEKVSVWPESSPAKE